MKIRVYRTNRKVPVSVYLTATKEQDGKLGSLDMYHVTNLDDFNDFRVDPGTNVWVGIADELNKPGVFDKLARFFKK